MDILNSKFCSAIDLFRKECGFVTGDVEVAQMELISKLHFQIIIVIFFNLNMNPYFKFSKFVQKNRRTLANYFSYNYLLFIY